MSKHTVGSTLQCVRHEDGLTFGKRYYAADDDYSAIAVINDSGVQLWFPDDCFRDALEMADERIKELETQVGKLQYDCERADSEIERIHRVCRHQETGCEPNSCVICGAPIEDPDSEY